MNTMETKNNVAIIGLLALIAGLIIGYFFGTSAYSGPSWMFDMHDDGGGHMYEEMGKRMYGEDIIDRDGAMIHAMDEMMLGFRGREGEEFEEAFLRSMIVHHLGAVEMSERVLEETDRPELRELARNIIETQTQEVDVMKGWLDEWFTN